MALRRPLTIRNGKAAEATDAETAFAAAAAVREYALNPSVLVNQNATGTSIGTLTDTRRLAGSPSTDNTAFIDSGQLAQTSVDTVTLTRHQQKTNPALNITVANPLYWDAATSKVREMTDLDFYDTYIAPALAYLTTDSTNQLFVGGTYFISTSSVSLSNSTIISATPFYSDSRADFSYYSTTGFATSYEVIGAGGGGGGGIGGGNGSAGGSSSISFVSSGSTVTITSNGGDGGLGSAQTGWGKGEDSFYGDGGLSGLNSDTNNQTSGDSPLAGAYGAGGGGGGARQFLDRNGGIGGNAGGTDGTSYTVNSYLSTATLIRYVGMPSTDSVSIDPGSTITITIGAGGAGGTGGGTNGAKGADGYAKLTVAGTVYEYTTPGTYTIDLDTSADLPKLTSVTSINQNYYLHRYNAATLNSSYYAYSPMYWDSANARFKQYSTVEWGSLLAQYIRHHASTKLNYAIGNSGDSGVNKGSAMTDTRSDSQIYTTDFDSPDDYISQMLPTSDTINTYDVKYLKLNLI